MPPGIIPRVKLILIYDKLIRPDTTGTLCEAALRTLGIDVQHYGPLSRQGNQLIFNQWHDLPPGDLYLQIDDDLAYPAPPQTLAAKAYWCIDVHRMTLMTGGPLTRWEKIKGFDKVFSAQFDMAQKLAVPWLPLAYDPAVIYPLEACPKIYDWCFIGNFIGTQRTTTVEQLKARFPNAFAGQAYGQEMNRIYNQSRLALNLSIGNDVNMRFFEVQGSGTPLLSNRVHNGEDQLFDSVLYFESVDELPDRIAALLAQPENLAVVAQRQLQCVRQQHTYIARMKKLLTLCGFPLA